MNRSDIRGEQMKLLQILKAFDSFCKEYDVKYYLFAGSCLGAVREHGFISWDGDIDLMISYPEYKKLERIVRDNGNMINGYKWYTYGMDKNIPTFFAKIFEPTVDSSHLEDFSYIELCPFVGAPNNKLLQKIVRKLYIRNYEIFWVKNRIYRHNLGRRHNQIGMLLKILLFWYPSCLALFIMKKICTHWKYSESDYIYYPCIYSIKRVLIPRVWLEESPVYMLFEDVQMPVPKQWDEYLTQIYGDYMTPVQYSRYK